MKTAFALLALTSLAAAQSTLPACAQPCIASAVSSTTTCGADDTACQCEPANKAAIQGAAAGCVITNCAGEAGSVLLAANAVCEALATAAPSSTPVENSPPINPETSSAPVSEETISISLITSSIADATTTAPVLTGSPSPRPNNATVSPTTTGRSNSASASPSVSSVVPAGGAGSIGSGLEGWMASLVVGVLGAVAWL